MEIRKQILIVLEEISMLNPSQRFGQLVANISFLAKGPVKSATYDVEDEEFLKAATSYLENLRQVPKDVMEQMSESKKTFSKAS